MAKTVLGTEVYDVYIEGTQEHGKNYSNETVFFNGNTIYSYGTHFPMAIRIDGWYLVNGDTYSNTTSKHQANLRNALRYEKTVIIPFSALDNAGIDKKSIKLIDQESDREIPYTYKDRTTGEERIGYQHLMGASLFAAKRFGNENAQYFLAGLDETGRNLNTSFFLSQIEGGVDTVEGAYHILKPNSVLKAEDNGLEVLRQGEWFFVPVTEEKEKELKDLEKKGKAEKNYLLPNRIEDRERRHKVTRSITINDTVYVRGTCRHTQGEHKMLKLDGWYEVHENTEVRSWVSAGRVD